MNHEHGNTKQAIITKFGMPKGNRIFKKEQIKVNRDEKT